MEAAILSGCTPGLTYDQALSDVSKRFVKESIIGSSEGLCPLLNKVTTEKQDELRVKMEQQLEASMGHVITSDASTSSTVMTRMKQNLEGTCKDDIQIVKVIEPPPVQVSPLLERKLQAWQADFDQIDWEVEMENNPSLRRALAKVSEKVMPKLSDSRAKQLVALHSDYDGIDWDEEICRNATLARHLGGSRSAHAQVFSGNSFSNLSNCTIQICLGPGRDSKDENKENLPCVDNTTGPIP